MPIFVEVYESIAEFLGHLQINEELNKILSSLQEKGAKIIDVKLSFSVSEGHEHRTYLILYEAENPIKPMHK